MNVVELDRTRLEALERAAVDLAALAGREVLAAFRAEVTLEFKGEKRADPVTAADRQAEALLRAAINARFPEHAILGEEVEGPGREADYTWVLDPIDGTINFASGLPLFGVSVGLLYRGAPVVGAIFTPMGPDLRPGVFHCARGAGARFEGRPIGAQPGPIEPARPVALPSAFRQMLRLVSNLGRGPGEVRTLGSISVELALVGAGVLQYAVFSAPRLWDVAAGALLVQEAGGSALVRGRDGWRELERFEPPARRRDGQPGTLRDWSRPLIAGGAEAAGQVAASLARPLGLRTLLRALFWRR